MIFKNIKGFRNGGVHPPEMKLTSGMPICDIPLPRRVVIYTGQSIGKPAKTTVSVKDHVERGQIIAEADGIISSNVHATISGTVTSIGLQPNQEGHPSEAIVIEANDEDHYADLRNISDAHPVTSEKDALTLDSKAIIEKIRAAGVVGLGGATFPVAVKLSIPESATNPTLLINGSECEPYLTSDEAVMRELPREVMTGIALLKRAIGADNAIVGIEDNKPEAIAEMRKAARPYDGISVVALHTKYPQGGEKMLIEALTGRKVAPGALPISVGAVVQNISTALAVYHAVIWDMPLMERVMTISGSGFSGRGNYRVTIGTEIDPLLKSLGGYDGQITELVSGGTMMGRGMASAEGATAKGTGGILLLGDHEVKRRSPSPCIRCGRCVDSCPMGLQPYLLSRLIENNRIEQAVSNGLMNCMECGCCAYSCISSRHLVDTIRAGKIVARKKKI